MFAAKKLWSYCVRFFLGVGVALDGYSIVCAASAFLFSCILMSAGPYRFRDWDALVRASELAGIAIVYAWAVAIPARLYFRRRVLGVERGSAQTFHFKSFASAVSAVLRYLLRHASCRVTVDFSHSVCGSFSLGAYASTLNKTPRRARGRDGTPWLRVAGLNLMRRG